jgi:undecaprenyl-diphosphatase
LVIVLPDFITAVAIAILSYSQVFYGVVLGVIQGISEWLPISSKTQILIASNYLFHLNFSEAYVFGLFMEIGTITAAVIYFRKEIASLTRALFRIGTKGERALFNYVVVSTIATGIVATPLYLIVDSIQGSYNIGFPMVLIGIVLIGDAILIKRTRSRARASKKGRKKLGDLGIKEYIIVGIAQGIAALPGVSRSGITTSTLLLLDVDTGDAFRLSFIDMIFSTTGAVFLTLFASKSAVLSAIGTIGASGLLIAIVVATIISILLIGFLLDMAKRSKIVYFISALGIIAIVGGAISAVFGVG